MKPPNKRVWIRVLGYAFLILGIIGLVLPVLQGLLFIIVGLAILSQTEPWAEFLMKKLRHRYPNVVKKSDKLLRKLKLKSDS